MKASKVSFRMAVIFAAAGVLMGIVMAASHNHSVMPAHAHLNLLGWVSLFLFGIFYKLHPHADESVFAKVQVVTWTIGATVLVTGVTLIYTGYPVGEALAGVGSIIALIGLVLFARVVFVETSSKYVTRQANAAITSAVAVNS